MQTALNNPSVFEKDYFLAYFHGTKVAFSVEECEAEDQNLSFLLVLLSLAHLRLIGAMKRSNQHSAFIYGANISSAPAEK